MPKYEVPLHYTVWVEVEAENENDAWESAGEFGSGTEFEIKTKYLVKEGYPEINFIDTGTPMTIEENENA